MRQTFLYAYASTDYLRITPPPLFNWKWLFFRLFPRNSYHRGRGHDLLKGEGAKKFLQLKLNFYVWRENFKWQEGILINNDSRDGGALEKLQLNLAWPRFNEGDILINNHGIAITETLSKNYVFSAKFARKLQKLIYLFVSSSDRCHRREKFHKILSLKEKKNNFIS